MFSEGLSPRAIFGLGGICNRKSRQGRQRYETGMCPCLQGGLCRLAAALRSMVYGSGEIVRGQMGTKTPAGSLRYAAVGNFESLMIGERTLR